MIQRDSLASLTLDTLPFSIAVLDADGTILFTNQAWGEFAGVGSGQGDMVGVNYFAGIDESADDYAARALTGIKAVIDGEQEVFKLEYPCHTPDSRQWFLMRAASLGGHQEGQVVVAHIDITQRKLAEIRARDKRRELERVMERIDGLVGNVMETALQASSRAEIEETLCTRLARVDPYVSAWVGHVDLPTDTISPAVAAGDGTPSLAATLSTAADDPTATAHRRGETQIVRDPGERSLDTIHERSIAAATRPAGSDTRDAVPDDPASRTAPGTALGAFPLVYNSTRYGVLTVYGAGEAAFDDRERAVLEVLARVVSTAINAVESKRILASDQVVELELGLDGADLFFSDIATSVGCTIVYEGSIYHDDGSVTMLFVTTNADPDAVLAAARDHEAVDAVTHVSDNDDQSVFEFHVSEPPLISQLAQRGAETTDIIAHEQDVRVTLELPASADIRAVVEQLSGQYPSTELLARHEHERPDKTKAELVADIEERLTDRQRLALRKAVLGGFFDWPRGVSGEELAASMDITPSTYHQHLRSAEKKLLLELFDE